MGKQRQRAAEFFKRILKLPYSGILTLTQLFPPLTSLSLTKTFNSSLVQMKVNTTPKRFLSVRLTSEELEEVYQLSKTSTCRSLTEYVKKVLTKKPVTVKVRNQSQDDLLETMIGIKSRLDQLAEQTHDKNEVEQLRGIAEVKAMTRQILERLNQD
jgi:hypothetical protein